MKQKLIIGNCKMNGSRASITALLASLAASSGEAVVCVPYPYLPLCAHLLTGSAVRLGAQDLSAHDYGAYTGEVSAAMLREFGCRYVLTGHSERRAYHHESDATIALKTRRALAAGLTPIVCVGETLQQRQEGQTEAVLTQQLQAVIKALAPGQLNQIVIAYEPVWAIGTGVSAAPDTAQQAHAIMRGLTGGAVALLYGGSVTPANAAALLAMPDIDGALVGGASLHADDFLAITLCSPRQ